MPQLPKVALASPWSFNLGIGLELLKSFLNLPQLSDLGEGKR